MGEDNKGKHRYSKIIKENASITLL